MSQSNTPARWRALAQVVTVMVLMVAVIAALGTAAGPAHAVPLGQCDGPCPPPTTPPTPPPPRGCFDCNSGATKPKPKLVTVYHRTYAYSTPYLNARSRHPVRPTTYVATCEAYSSAAGRYRNRWWSRMREGTWVNNGDLRGGVKMGIGDCAAPPNDGQPRGGRQGCDDCRPRAPQVLPTRMPPCPDSHGSRNPAPASSPLPQTHAHNDYQHEHPLFDALSHRFSSVEADVWLNDDGRLLVGHGKNTLQYPECTLQALYLDPLLALVRANGGHVYAGSAAPLQLLVDVKSMGTKTVLALDRLLRERYASMLTSWSSGVEHPGAIRVVISGNRDPALMEFKPQRYAVYDGGRCELRSGAPANVARLCKKPPRGGGAAAGLIPLISINWASVFTWKGGRDKMPANERVLLRAIVARAHSHGQQVRFWNTPERYPFWQAELDAGVDWLNTDNLCALEAFLARCPTDHP